MQRPPRTYSHRKVLERAPASTHGDGNRFQCAFRIPVRQCDAHLRCHLPRDASGNLTYSSTVANTTGRRGNQGMEGMAVTPDGKKLVTLLQSGALQ
ncbi:MAG: esterase-like activity of phytase family protein, partial [Acidobacteriota bacterium]